MPGYEDLPDGITVEGDDALSGPTSVDAIDPSASGNQAGITLDGP